MLIVGPNVLNDRVGAGVTLRSLFAQWPRDRLAQIHSDTETPDDEAAADFFRLNEGERLVGPFVVRQAIRHLRSFTGRGETGTFFGGRITRRLSRWLDHVRPHVILSQLGGLAMGEISLEIARRRRIPFVLHMSDDWVQGWPANTLGRSIFPITHLANRAMRDLLRRAIAEATVVTVISDEMADEYERRYGRRGRVLHNGVDLTEWPARGPIQAGTPARVVYSGSVFPYGQLAALEDARDAVSPLSGVRLVIHTQHARSDRHRQAFARAPGVDLHDLVPHADLARNLGAADVLLLPVNFDRVTREFLRVSMPGKLAEYLASGTPVLYYGPPDVAQARFLAKNDCALLVTERDIAALRSAIARLVDDDSLRARLSEAGRAVVARAFDIRALRAALRATIAEAVAAGAA